MSNTNADSPSPEIQFCPELRDKVFEHLPRQAKSALLGVEVRFWPNNHGEMELHLRYDPTDNLLDIDAKEAIYGPDERITGYFVRGCELDSETGEIHAYCEHMVATGTLPPINSTMVLAEKDVNRFDLEKLSFLLRLFNSL